MLSHTTHSLSKKREIESSCLLYFGHSALLWSLCMLFRLGKRRQGCPWSIIFSATLLRINISNKVWITLLSTWHTSIIQRKVVCEFTFSTFLKGTKKRVKHHVYISSIKNGSPGFKTQFIFKINGFSLVHSAFDTGGWVGSNVKRQWG